MRKLALLVAMVSAMVLISFVGSAAADSPNVGCRDGWTVAVAVSPDAISRDRNGDLRVCFKAVNGTGNGNYLSPNIVVTDNNTPPAAG